MGGKREERMILKVKENAPESALEKKKGGKGGSGLERGRKSKGHGQGGEKKELYDYVTKKKRKKSLRVVRLRREEGLPLPCGGHGGKEKC